MILRSTHYRSGFNASEGPSIFWVGVKLQSIKIFPEREDRASIFSSVDVYEEISNQTKTRKEVRAEYIVQPVSGF